MPVAEPGIQDSCISLKNERIYMAQSQHPKTMKVEIMKSLKKLGLFGMHILKFTNSSGLFAFFQTCTSDLPLPESGYHKTEANTVNSQSKRRCVDLGGVTIYA